MYLKISDKCCRTPSSSRTSGAYPVVQRGHTILELSATIVILAVLTVTVMPKFVNMSASARESLIAHSAGALGSANHLNLANLILAERGYQRDVVPITTCESAIDLLDEELDPNLIVVAALQDSDGNMSNGGVNQGNGGGSGGNGGNGGNGGGNGSGNGNSGNNCSNGNNGTHGQSCDGSGRVVEGGPYGSRSCIVCYSSVTGGVCDGDSAVYHFTAYLTQPD